MTKVKNTWESLPNESTSITERFIGVNNILALDAEGGEKNFEGFSSEITGTLLICKRMKQKEPLYKISWEEPTLPNLFP